jgi:hypothetical protein
MVRGRRVSELVGFDDVRPGDIILDHAGNVWTVANTSNVRIIYCPGIWPLDQLPQGEHDRRTTHCDDWPIHHKQLRLYRSGQRETP